MAPLIVAGFLRMSEKSKRMNAQGKELFRFVPISQDSLCEVYPEFNATTSTILVASGAASDRKKGKQKGDSFMPDLYVLAEILDEERKGDEWKARVVEMLGECTDLHSCGLVLAHKGRLMDGNKSLDHNKPPKKDEKQSSNPQTVFGVKKAAPSGPISPPKCVLSADRVDLRASKCTIFSVDPPGCVDIDDAVHVRVLSPEERGSVETVVVTKLGLSAASPAERSAVLSNTVLYEVGVHIADVINYVKDHCHSFDSGDIIPGQADPRMEKIVLEALHRSFTVYLPNQQIPILPAYLSHDACSLHAGEDRYTMSCILTLACSADPVAPATTTAGSAAPQNRTFVSENTSIPLESQHEHRAYTVISYRFQKSLISSAGAFTYDQIDQFLDGTSISAPIPTTPAVSVVSEQKRKSSVATAAATTKVPTKVESQGIDMAAPKALPKDVKYSLKLFRKLFPTLDSHKIIEQLMLTANICAAEFLEAWTVPSSSTDGAIHRDTLNACLLRRQLPAGYDPLLPLDSAENAAVLASQVENKMKGATAQRGAFAGVPMELTAHSAEYIYCPADSSTGKEAGSKVCSDVADRDASPSVGSVLSAVEKAHASLGCAVYTHFTSPIRRYADQLVHALMNHILSQSLSASTSALSLASSSRSPVAVDPWLSTFTPANVAQINKKQKQHKKFQREMTIVEFVFNQCASAGATECTIDAEAVVLPMRYSDKHRGFKADLYVLAPCGFVYPLRLHTRAQAQLYEVTYTSKGVTMRSKQTGEVKRLQVGQKIPVQVHCIKSAPSLRKKCVLSSPSITF